MSLPNPVQKSHDVINNKLSFMKGYEESMKMAAARILSPDNLINGHRLTGLVSKASAMEGELVSLSTRPQTATAGSDVIQSGRPIFDDIFQHVWPYIGNNTANVVFQMVKRLWLIRIDQ
ncbi:hypothetical protein TNCV_1567581 [Trichonephila clavipes]|nr:hypothetical protein TNCV_1567581 [Trichonephila clavipes]